MAKLIVVLEDNIDRTEAMKQKLAERFSQHDTFFSDDPGQLIDRLKTRWHDVLVVSLDHDLHERPDQSTELTGMIVADFLASKVPAFPILLHTTNTRDGDRMQNMLTEAKWRVTRVIPFDGVNWVFNEWHRAIRKAIQHQLETVRVDDSCEDELQNNGQEN